MSPRCLLLALLLSACGPRAAPGPDGGAPAAREPPWPGLTLDLTPDPERREVAVEVRLAGDRAASVTEVSIARAWADTRAAEALVGLHASDAQGDLHLQPRRDDGGPDDVYALARAPRGELVVRYRARGDQGASRFALRVAPDRVSGVGHAFLLLPRVDAPIAARVRIHTGALARGADAASSFGFGGEVVTTATSEDLAHAVYVAGMLWREGEGGRQLVVLGNPPFDTRTAFAHAVAEGAAVNRFFGAAFAEPEPFTFVLVGQPGLGRAHDGAYLTRSVGVWFDARQHLDGELDLVLAHELVHRFLGGTVRLVGRGGREATWFSEGFTVHAARRALLQAGLLSPADFAADVNRVAGESAAGEEQLPAEYRRGALHAAWLDTAIRRASHGARSLDDVLRALTAEARAAGKASLPVAALREALVREVGAEGGTAVDRLDAGDAAPPLPDDAFGPCARRRVREARGFELGFDRRSLAGTPALVRGLVKASAAERAGLREGALVLTSRVPSESDALSDSGAPREVELWLADGKRVRYRPVGTKRETTWEAAPCRGAPAGGPGAL